MGILSVGAKVIGKALSPAEKAASDFVKGVSKIIPSETKTGQTGLFMPSDYKIPTPKRTPQGGPGLGGIMSTPPFKGGGKFMSGDPRAVVTGTARREELAMKRKVSASKAAITQQNAMDVAKKAGQITDREIVKQNKILMRRRKAAKGM
jgi:hypothetical protein